VFDLGRVGVEGKETIRYLRPVTVLFNEKDVVILIRYAERCELELFCGVLYRV